MKYTVTEFINQLQRYNNEDIGCDGRRISSHDSIKSHVSFIVETGENEDDEFYEVKEIKIDRLLGCQCACGINIILTLEK